MTEFVSDKFSWKIRQGDALSVLADMPADSVDTICTSPPYWGLRDYGVDGQLGLELHPSLYLEHLWEIFDEVKRVLKPTGTCWVNLGDTFAGSHCGANDYRGDGASISASTAKYKGQGSAVAANGSEWLKPKNLLMIPARFAIGMQERGWWLRNDCCWFKPNSMPSSVKDRFSCSWEHIFFFTKAARYWFDLDAVREEHTALERPPGNKSRMYIDRDPQHQGGEKRRPGEETSFHALGKNPGDCWIIPTFAFSEAHFAVYPPELIRKPIRAGCPPKVCVECGKPWERLTEQEKVTSPGQPPIDTPQIGAKSEVAGNDVKRFPVRYEVARRTIGWQPTCECAGQQTCPDCKGLGIIYISKPLRQQDEPENDEMYDKCLRCQGTGRVGKEGPTEPGIVLDPFSGAGTTGVVCIEEDRNYIGIELSEEYCEIQHQRLEKATRQKQHTLEL